MGHEGGGFVNGICVLMKEPPQSSVAPSTMWGHSKMAALYESGSGPCPTWPYRCLKFGFAASRNHEREILLFTGDTVCDILL